MAETSVLILTDAARAKVLEVRAAEKDPEELALWLEVSGAEGTSFTYDMYFRRLDEAVAGDEVIKDDGIAVVVPSAHVDKVRGSTLDLQGGGMLLQNPNSPPPPQAAATKPQGDLSGPVAQAVITVLDEEINPAIAAHGGTAELVAVEEPIAYLRLGGGCQGCGLAAVTLSQGISVAILDKVPEITEVVDVTDHAGGTNPYFESSAK